MLEDHSSRWSAAPSPGGMIGLLLMILSLVALTVSVLSLMGRLDIGLDEAVLYALLGVSTFTTFMLLYLLIGYMSIGYRMDGEKLSISSGLWSVDIPYEEIETVDLASNIIGEQRSLWQPYWRGYYAGTRNTDVGKIHVLATLPEDEQVVISLKNGEWHAVSPEHPALFMEQLLRWQRINTQPDELEGDQSAESTPDAQDDEQADLLEVPAHGWGWTTAQSTEHERQTASDDEGQPVTQPDPTDSSPLEPVAQVATVHEQKVAVRLEPQPEPVFGTTSLADQVPADAPDAGFIVPDTARSYRQPPEYIGPEIPGEPDPDTARYRIIDSELALGPERAQQHAPQSPATADGHAEPASAGVAEPDSGSPQTPLVAPRPVILPLRPPRSEVLQPLTRASQTKPSSASPAIHQDSIALTFVGLGMLATAAMATFILVQYDDLPQSLTFHWNVEGDPGRIGGPQEIWALPIVAAIVLVANAGLAWGIAKFDQFAARLLLGSTVVVHIITWIALLMIL
jgi:hypothetical protein